MAREGMRLPVRPLGGPCMALWVGLLAIVALSWSVPGTEATRDTWKDDTTKILYYVDRFAFKKNGKFNIQIDPVQKGLRLNLLICRDGQYDNMIDGYSNSDGRKVCSRIARNDSRCGVVPFRGFLNLTGTTGNRDMYWFVLVNCNQSRLDLEFYESFINPDDEYLGWDNLPLPYLYGLLIIVYLVLLGAWLLNIFMIDMGAGSNRLHKYLSIWPVMKLGIVIFNTGYWAYLSEEGVMHWSMVVVYVIYNSLWYTYMFGALLLIALAWGISRTQVNMIEGIIFAAIQVIFYVTWVINFALEGYYVVVSVFGLGLMLIAIYSFAYMSLKSVEASIKKSQALNTAAAPDSFNDAAGPVSQSTNGSTELRDLRYQRSKLTLEERKRVLGHFLWIHLCYIIPMIAWALLYAGLFHYENWAYRTLVEATELCLVVALGWVFRLRRRNIYFEFNDEALNDWEKRDGSPTTDAGADGHIEMDAIPHASSVGTLHNPDDSHIAPEDDSLPPVNPLPRDNNPW